MFRLFLPICFVFFSLFAHAQHPWYWTEIKAERGHQVEAKSKGANPDEFPVRMSEEQCVARRAKRIDLALCRSQPLPQKSVHSRAQHLPPPPAPRCLASILKFPPDRAPKEIAYKDLVCTEQDRANIYEIVSTVGRTSKLGLVPKTGHLKRLGAQISHVHPLKFLGTIFSHPELKACMRDIFDDYFKRSSFMDDLAPALSREANKGKLHMYLEDFSEEVGHHPHNTHLIRGHFDSQEWDNLVRFLIKN